MSGTAARLNDISDSTPRSNGLTVRAAYLSSINRGHATPLWKGRPDGTAEETMTIRGVDIITVLDRDGEPYETIEVESSEDSEPYDTALRDAGWTILNPLFRNSPQDPGANWYVMLLPEAHSNPGLVTLNQEMPGGTHHPDENGWVLRSRGDELGVWEGAVEDLAGAQAWATVRTAEQGMLVDRWEQHEDGRCSDWPYWTAVPMRMPAAEVANEIIRRCPALSPMRLVPHDVNRLVDAVARLNTSIPGLNTTVPHLVYGCIVTGITESLTPLLPEADLPMAT